MSELNHNQTSRAAIRRNLLLTASALALATSIGGLDNALADETDRPTVWVELGGQMEFMQGTSSLLTPPFVFISPTPGSYKPESLIDTQQPPHRAFGLEGSFSFQPESSDWVFFARLRYGRAHLNRHVHHQTAVFYTYSVPRQKYVAEFTDTKNRVEESHTILDFEAGHDVGLGLFGRYGKSTISGGVRFAQFSSHSSLDIDARPTVDLVPFTPSSPGALPAFDQHKLGAHAERSFRGIGPEVSWNASAALLGNPDHAELAADWGINAALLFGRQKARTDHRTADYHFTYFGSDHYAEVYPAHSGAANRSRSTVVPNLGGFAGLSLNYPNAKVSFGYRADFFFGAVDAGFDTRHTKDLGFHGPFATISIGLGG